MKLSRRHFLVLGGGALAASALPAWAVETRVLRGRAFGASWSFVGAAMGDDAAIVSAFEEIVASVDAAMSPFRADSEIGRLNRSIDTDWQALSAETCAVVGEALRIAELTGNAFNPTLGPLVGRYGFGPITDGEPGLPQEISVREDAVRKARAGLSLDLCGIAKGRALDRMAQAIHGIGLDDFMIELGGEVLASGSHPAGRPWQIGVEAPESAGFQHVVAANGVALATSGSAVNAYSYGGKRYSHIIDPVTRRPAETALFSVTVAADTGMTADALATALFAMGAERGADFARGRGIEALFVMNDGEEIATSGFEARILG